MPDMQLIELILWAGALVAGLLVLIDAYQNGGILQFFLVLLIAPYTLYYALFRQTKYRAVVVLLLVAPIGLEVAKAAGLIGGRNDPCRLVTQSDVAEVFGRVFKDGSHHSDTLGQSCWYVTVDEPRQVFVLQVGPSEIMESLEGQLGRKGFKVSDLGDVAFSYGPVLYVKKDAAAFGLTMTAGDEPRLSGYTAGSESAFRTLEARKKLAQIAIDRYKF